jgi:hypothetical protein
MSNCQSTIINEAYTAFSITQIKLTVVHRSDENSAGVGAVQYQSYGETFLHVIAEKLEI